ncbi:hypothetical protein ACQPYK_08470 [Streptosporangium sp. CA-135522]|uniref:hypothetical protein n=1 Tax=Streptosporangium sp. CA-135522 TaxID=3240072 RepID=UPI003D8E210D
MHHPIGADTPEPNPEDVARGLAELELHLAGQVPAEQPAVDLSRGETKRVKALRAEVAEAHLLAQLQDDDTPLLLDTVKVRKRRKQAGEAARLHQLAQDPTMRAWQAARMRRLLVAGAMVALALALAWSTVGVQKFAADGASLWSPAWIIAWLVEPFLSLALMVVVGARAYIGTHGQPIESPTLARIEYLFLALTLGMNAWPHLAVSSFEEFSFSQLMLHMLGPIVTVAVVTALPIILAAFSDLDHGGTGTPRTGPSYRANVEALTVRARALIDAGELPADAGAGKIRAALGCGMDPARAVRDALTRGQASGGAA